MNTATVSIQREGAKVRIHICEGANTYFNQTIPQKYSPVFERVRIQAPHVLARKLLPQEFFLYVLVLFRGVPELLRSDSLLISCVWKWLCKQP